MTAVEEVEAGGLALIGNLIPEGRKPGRFLEGFAARPESLVKKFKISNDAPHRG
jgi:hypothetical protein